MKTSAKNRVKGSAKEATRRLKEAAGYATRSRRLARRRRAQAAGGRLRRKVGEVQQDLEEASEY